MLSDNLDREEHHSEIVSPILNRFNVPPLIAATASRPPLMAILNMKITKIIQRGTPLGMARPTVPYTTDNSGRGTGTLMWTREGVVPRVCA